MASAKNRILARRGTVNRLVRAVDTHRCVVIVSPMGYGKTTVARQYAEREKRTAYFFTVPAEQHDADCLWSLMWQEVGKQGMREAPSLRRMGFPRNEMNARHVVDILDEAEPAVIIIDDYHYCADREMDHYLETAICAGSDTCRVVLLSRTMPGINLEELAIQGIAAVYDQTFLAFSEAETKEYFFLNDIPDGSVASHAWKYSEGWPAALWLCLRQCKRDSALPPPGDIEILLDTAVYSAYSRAEQAMLMQLSVLDSFTIPEAEKLTLDAGVRQRIVRIRNRNAFFIRDPHKLRYQFHSIFRTFLQKRLEREPELCTPALYRRAAECHAGRREFMTAYRLLARTGREEDYARLLALLACQGGEIMPDCQWQELQAIVQAIPWGIRAKEPFGYVTFIWLCICMGAESFDPAQLREAEKRFGNAKSIAPKIKRRLAGELEFIRGVLAFNDYVAVFKHYVKASRYLDGPSCLVYKRLSWSFGCPYINFVCHNRPGHFRLLKDLTGKHQKKIDSLTEGVGLGTDLVVAAEYYLERGELDKAERLLDDILERVDKDLHTTSFLLALFSKARLLLARGKQSAATALLRKSAARIEKTDMFEHILCHDLALGYIEATRGHAEHLPRWLADGNVYEPPYATVQIMAFILTVYGKTLLARGDYKGLSELLEKSPDGFSPFPTPMSVMHIRIFEAIIAKRNRETDKALQSLEAALEISRPDGLVLTYAEYGDKILSLLHRLRHRRPDDPHLEKIIALCKRAGRMPESRKKYQLSFLGPGENKVMRLVAVGKTTSAIARRLRLAETTVKSILAHVYVKLEAGNRAEAVKRFEALSERKSNASGSGTMPALTKREQQIMHMMRQGMATAAIAADLGISRETVKRLLASIYSKLHVSNRIQAVRVFSRNYGKHDTAVLGDFHTISSSTHQ